MIVVRRFTIARSVTVSGRGLHGGLPVTVVFEPGDDGVQLVHGGTRVRVSPAAVTDTTRSTTVGTVRTVEHVMSALSGLGITDVTIMLTSPEMPAMDGSAADFVTALAAVGLVDLGRVEMPFPQGSIQLRSGDAEIDISAGSGTWSYSYQSATQWPFRRVFSVDDMSRTYVSDVARARTFLYERDLDHLDDQGLARGISRRTALIVGSEGYLTPARMADEMVAHKLLDLVGDLFLVGIPARYLDVRACCSGHRTNVAAARLAFTR